MEITIRQTFDMGYIRKRDPYGAFSRKGKLSDFVRWIIEKIESVLSGRDLCRAEDDSDGVDEQASAVYDRTRGETAGERAGELLERHGNSILRLCYSYLHNMSDAEDILQDTLIQYIKTAPVLENEKHERAWLLKVASNLSKNRIQYNKRRQTDELEETLVAEEAEDLSFVWSAVKKLPDKYREVVHLFYYEGYATKEIAKILQRNESTVRSDLKRGREQLKGILKEGYDFE